MSSILANFWSFLLTFVRSLLALFSASRRTPAPNDALARAHSHLRPIVLTPRSIARAHSQRITPVTLSDTTTTEPRGNFDTQTNFTKLEALDPELGLPPVCDNPGPPAASAASFREGTPDTSVTGSSSCVAPLTPPERCYLAPLPSTTDCPYMESWPANVPVDRSKLPASPLRVSIHTNSSFPEPMVVPIGSPPPGRWNPEPIWPSSKDDNPAVSYQVHSPCDYHRNSPALASISHALISRSQSSFRPYDDTSRSSMSSDAISPVSPANGPRCSTRERHRAQARIPRSEYQPYPRFHHPDAYAWRHHAGRLPGKANRKHGPACSRSDTDFTGREWYDADAYAPSPVPALSPPLAEDEDEDDLPLGCLRERLALAPRGLSLGIPSGMATHAPLGVSHTHGRHMSEGCLFAIAESTPTRIGLRTRSGRHAISLALDGDGGEVKDWLEALSLHVASDRKDLARACDSAPSVRALAV